MCLPSAPIWTTAPPPFLMLTSDWPSDALTRRPIDSVVVSALRNNQWLLGGASTSVALQGCHTVSANYRHHLLLPPVSNPPRRMDRTTAMDSATLPKIPFLLCPPSSNLKLCLSVLSGSGYFCVCERLRSVHSWQSSYVLWVVRVVLTLWWYPASLDIFPLELFSYDWVNRSDRVGDTDGYMGWCFWFWKWWVAANVFCKYV